MVILDVEAEAMKGNNGADPPVFKILKNATKVSGMGSIQKLGRDRGDSRSEWGASYSRTVSLYVWGVIDESETDPAPGIKSPMAAN